MNVLAPYLYIKGLPAESASATLIADCPAGIAAEHIFILNFIAVGFHPLEEFVESDYGFLLSGRRHSLPDYIFDLSAEVAVRLKDRNSILGGIAYQLVIEPAHLLSPPAGNGTVIYGLALVRNYKVFADTDDLSESATHRTGSKRAVETEQVLIRLGELHSVRLKAVYELTHHRR